MSDLAPFNTKPSIKVKLITTTNSKCKFECLAYFYWPRLRNSFNA